jgi:twitching motility two-component system response regulator PilH
MPDADAADVKTYVVLVVDDNEDIRLLLGEFLHHAFPCSIRTAADECEALESLRACRPLPDLIVLDWMMPNASGADVLAAMEKEPELAQIPVVVCSAMEVKVPAYVPVVPKPVDPVEFIAVVRNLLSGGGRQSAVLVARSEGSPRRAWARGAGARCKTRA